MGTCTHVLITIRRHAHLHIIKNNKKNKCLLRALKMKTKGRATHFQKQEASQCACRRETIREKDPHIMYAEVHVCSDNLTFLGAFSSWNGVAREKWPPKATDLL